MADLKLTATYKEYGDEIWFGGDGCGMWIIESDPHNDLTAYLGGLGETKEGRDAMEARARLLAAAPELYDALEEVLANVPWKNWCEDDSANYPFIDKALAALARARGEK